MLKHKKEAYHLISFFFYAELFSSADLSESASG